MGSEGLHERYINPYTDFGFKKLFGTELNKDLLISLLNALLPDNQVIKEVTYLNTEHLGTSEIDRRAVFDVYCENERGEKFLVEMQRDDYYHHEVRLVDMRTKEVFYDKLTLVYLEMPKFNKREDELITMSDKWMFVLRNLARLMERPAALQERIFTRLFEAAEIAQFNRKELVEYEDSLKVFRDMYSVVETAINKGLAKGRAEGRAEGRVEGLAEGEKRKQLEIALKMKAFGTPVEVIVQLTGLSTEEVSDL